MDSVPRRLESAIRQMERRLRDAQGEDQQLALEAAREEVNALLDEAAYARRPPSPAPGTSSLRSSARRLAQVERQLDSMQQLNALQEEMRWVDEEASQARRELEDRLEARIVAVEARVTALVAMNNETDLRLRELERKSELQESIAKRTRITMEELADKVTQVVSDIQQRLFSADDQELLNGPRQPLASRESARRQTKSSEQLVRDLLTRVESLESELESEKERSVRAVELVASALTPSRKSASSTVSPDRGGSGSGLRRPLHSSSASARRLSMEEFAPSRNGEPPSASKRHY